MYWLRLDVEREGSGETARTPLRLPCPADELLSIVAAASASDESYSQHLHRALRSNPALLLFALGCYHRAVGAAPKRPHVLVEWCCEHLLAELALQPFEPITFDPPKETKSELEGQSRKHLRFDVAGWEAFLRARKNKKLTIALIHWLDGSRRLQKALGLKNITSKGLNRELVESLLAKSFRADHFRCSGIRQRQTLSRLQHAWESSHPIAVCLATLFQMAIKNRESDHEFERRILVEKLAAMKQLAYGASHEINNPLANIATRSQALLLNETHPEKRHRLAVIYQQAMRAHEMISDMMLFAHPPALKPQWTSARLLVSKFLCQLDSEMLERDRVEVRVVVAAGVDNVLVDPTQFLVALENLVRNSWEAIQASNVERGEIGIRISVGDGKFRVSVTDNGIGIEPRVAQHLFDPFFSGREAGRGLGFGLSKVWRIAEMHGGELYWDEPCETGTQFVLEFPVGVESESKWRGGCEGGFEHAVSAVTKEERTDTPQLERSRLRIA